MKPHCPGLAVHVIWHPRSSEGKRLARALFAHLFEDAEDVSSHGLRIPVWQWCSSDDTSGEVPPPDPLPLERSRRAVVVPIVDRCLLAAYGWEAFLAETAGHLRSQDSLVPVYVQGKLPDSVKRPQAIGLEDVVGDDLRLHRVRNKLTEHLCGIVAPDQHPVRVFISYASADQEIGERVIAHLHKGGSVEGFFAPERLRPGEDWAATIEREAGRSLMLAIRTDAYGGREWCQREVLKAKLCGMPVVVLDALEDREARGFPYLGNGPVLRWRRESGVPELEDLLSIMLREALRFRYFRQRVVDLCELHGKTCPEVRPVPPELVTMLEAAGGSQRLLVYPDPPLAKDELDVIQSLNPNLCPVTPLMLLAS